MSAAAEEIQYCTVHTTAEATLRCNKCERWMCVKCAVQTPVGYRCRECIRGLENKFFTANSSDYLLVGTIAAGLGLLGAGIMAFLPFGLYLALLAGIPAGGMMSEVVRRVVNKRRGRYTALVAAGGVIVGGLVPILLSLRTGGFVAVGLFLVLAAGAVYGRFTLYK
jgi:hypothetical protein